MRIRRHVYAIAVDEVTVSVVHRSGIVRNILKTEEKFLKTGGTQGDDDDDDDDSDGSDDDDSDGDDDDFDDDSNDDDSNDDDSDDDDSDGDDGDDDDDVMVMMV